MSPCEARLLIKQPSETVKFILGRDRNKANEENKTTRKLLSTGELRDILVLSQHGDLSP